jgi:hypothetical protein
MIRRITLQNYMSHAETVIEPAAGLTVLVGPNNCGKSAVVSALETLCNNAAGAYMVRHDEKEARVTVETDDGHTVVWKRRGNTVSYSIDGRDIHRVARGVPDDLHVILRLPKVTSAEIGDPFDIHFGTQKSPIFLLNEPESRAALFFASSSDAAILLEMQKRHRSRVRERKNDEKRLKGEIHKLDAELEIFAPLDAIARSVHATEQEHEELKQLANRIPKLDQELQALRHCTLSHDRLGQRYQCLAPLRSAPHLADTAAFVSLMEALLIAQNQFRQASAKSRAIDGLLSPPQLGDTPTLEDTIQLLSGGKRTLAKWAGHAGIVRALRAPPAFDDEKGLQSLHRTLSFQDKNVRHLKARSDCLGRLAETPALSETEPLEEVMVSLKSAQVANAACRHRQRIVDSLAPLPELANTEALSNLIQQLGIAVEEVGQLTGFIADLDARVADLEMTALAVEQASAGYRQPVRSERSQVQMALLALSGAACLAALIFLSASFSGWFIQSSATHSDTIEKSTDPSLGATVPPGDKGGIGQAERHREFAATSPGRLTNTADLGRTRTVAKTDKEAFSPVTPLPANATSPDSRKSTTVKGDRSVVAPSAVDQMPQPLALRADTSTQAPTAKSLGGTHETPSVETKAVRNANDEKRTRNLAPAPGAPDVERELRLTKVRQLLADGRAASERDRHLEALVAFGQAALMYPQEVAQVDNPERVRIQFVDALRGYQAEVERALQLSSSQRNDGRQP